MGASATPETAESRRPLRVGVAVSGGADSMTLLYATWTVAAQRGMEVHALHVHHGLQAVADAWPSFIADACRSWAQRHPERSAVQVHVRRLSGAPLAGDSTEEWARSERYRSLTEMATTLGIDLVLLAHHELDQAETLLLQALRGAGAAGLAGMPRERVRDGVRWARPWLSQPPARIRVAAAHYAVSSIEDPSNHDGRYARNRLRHQVWPVLEAAFPQARQCLARAAVQTGRSLQALHAAESQCAQALMVPGRQGLEVRLSSAWTEVDESQRLAALRHWMRELPVPRIPGSLLERLARETLMERPAQWLWGAGWFRWYRGSLRWEPSDSSAAAPPVVHWSWTPGISGQESFGFLEWGGGRLECTRVPPDAWGVRLEEGLTIRWTVRCRSGGDALQCTVHGIPRSLKKQFQAAGVDAWRREGPVVCSAEGQVLWVAALGWDARLPKELGGWTLAWQPGASG